MWDVEEYERAAAQAVAAMARYVAGSQAGVGPAHDGAAWRFAVVHHHSAVEVGLVPRCQHGGARQQQA